MEKFSCQRCGICCTNIGGRFSDREIKRIGEAFRELERIGIYLVIPPEDLSIPLFPDEVKAMIELSNKIDVKFRPQPKLVILDKNKEYVIEWDLGDRICPFYNKEKGCLIYEHRPLACKSFPVILKPNGYELLSICPETRKYKESTDREIEQIFEQESMYAKMFNEKVKERKERLLQMIRDKEIIPIKASMENILNLKKNIIEKSLKEPSRITDILS